MTSLAENSSVCNSDLFSLLDWNEYAEGGEEESIGAHSLSFPQPNVKDPISIPILIPVSISSSSSSSFPRRKAGGEGDSNKASMKKTKLQLRSEREAKVRKANLEAIVQMAHDFQAFLNAGDLVSLRELIQGYFAAGCEFHSSFMTTPVFGADSIFRLYSTVVEVVPDCTGIIQQVKFDNERGVLTVRTNFSGTTCFPCSLKENPHMDPANNLSGDCPDYEVRLKCAELMKAGKRTVVCGEITWSMFLDASFAKAQKVFVRKRFLSVDEAPPLR